LNIVLKVTEGGGKIEAVEREGARHA